MGAGRLRTGDRDDVSGQETGGRRRGLRTDGRVIDQRGRRGRDAGVGRGDVEIAGDQERVRQARNRGSEGAGADERIGADDELTRRGKRRAGRDEREGDVAVGAVRIDVGTAGSRTATARVGKRVEDAAAVLIDDGRQGGNAAVGAVGGIGVRDDRQGVRGQDLDLEVARGVGDRVVATGGRTSRDEHARVGADRVDRAVVAGDGDARGATGEEHRRALAIGEADVVHAEETRGVGHALELHRVLGGDDERSPIDRDASRVGRDGVVGSGAGREAEAAGRDGVGADVRRGREAGRGHREAVEHVVDRDAVDRDTIDDAGGLGARADRSQGLAVGLRLRGLGEGERGGRDLKTEVGRLGAVTDQGDIHAGGHEHAVSAGQGVGIGSAARGHLLSRQRTILGARAGDGVHEVSHRQTELHAVGDHVEVFDAADDREAGVLDRVADQAGIEEILQRAGDGDGVVSRARVVGTVDLREVIREQQVGLRDEAELDGGTDRGPRGGVIAAEGVEDLGGIEAGGRRDRRACRDVTRGISLAEERVAEVQGAESGIQVGERVLRGSRGRVRGHGRHARVEIDVAVRGGDRVAIEADDLSAGGDADREIGARGDGHGTGTVVDDLRRGDVAVVGRKDEDAGVGVLGHRGGRRGDDRGRIADRADGDRARRGGVGDGDRVVIAATERDEARVAVDRIIDDRDRAREADGGLVGRDPRGDTGDIDRILPDGESAGGGEGAGGDAHALIGRGSRARDALERDATRGSQVRGDQQAVEGGAVSRGVGRGDTAGSAVEPRVVQEDRARHVQGAVDDDLGAAGEVLVMDGAGRTGREGDHAGVDDRELVARRGVIGDLGRMARSVRRDGDRAVLGDDVVRGEEHAAAAREARDVAVLDDAGRATRGGLVARDAQIAAAGEHVELTYGDRGDRRGAEIVADDRDGLAAEPVDGARVIDAIAGACDAIEHHRAGGAGDVIVDQDRLGGGGAVGRAPEDDAILADQRLAGVDDDGVARGREGDVARREETADRRGAGRGRAVSVVDRDDARDRGQGAGVKDGAAREHVIVDPRGRTGRDGQRRVDDDGRGFVATGDVIGHRAGMAARIGDHADQAVLGDVVIRTEGGAAAVAVDADRAFLIDAIAGLRDGIARDREVAAAGEDAESTEADRVTGQAGGVTHDVDRLGGDAAITVEADGHGDAVTGAADGAGHADLARRSAERRRIPLDVRPQIADAETVRRRTREGDIPLRARDVIEQHDGDAIDTRIDDRTNGHAAVARQGVALVDHDGIRGGGQGGQVSRGNEAADGRGASRGGAIGVVERDDARNADEARIEGRAAREHVVVDARGRTGGDDGVRGDDRGGLVARRDVVGDRAAVAARVGHHRDGAGLVHVVVRAERHAAAVGVVGDVAVGVDAVADLVEAVARDHDVAEHARGDLAGGEGQDRHGALADGTIGAGKRTRSGEGDALGGQQGGEVDAVTGRGHAQDRDDARGRGHLRSARNAAATEGNATQDDAGGAAERVIDRDAVGARDQGRAQGGSVEVTADRRRTGRGGAVGIVEGDDPRDGDRPRVDRRTGGILVEIDVRGRPGRDGQVPRDDGRTLAARGDVIRHRAGLAARVADHGDVARVVDVVVGPEQHVTAVGVHHDTPRGVDTLT